MVAKKNSIVTFKYSENEVERFCVVHFDVILKKSFENTQGFATWQKGITVNIWSQPHICPYNIVDGTLIVLLQDYQLVLSIEDIVEDEFEAILISHNSEKIVVRMKHYIDY